MADEIDQLAAALPGMIHRPGSRGHAEGTAVFAWQGRLKRPTAVVRPRTAEQVAVALRWATATGHRFTLRSGGHSFDGSSVADGAMLLDLRSMDGWSIDGEVLTVGPGVRSGAITAALAPLGLALPVGDCPTVGLAGLTSGAGFGYLSRKLGVTIDSVQALELVTPAAGVVRVSETEYPDLFWAARGGGGSAGVATSITVAAIPVNRVVSIHVDVAWEAAAEAFSVYAGVLAGAPRELDLKFKIRTTGRDRFMDMDSDGPTGATAGVPLVTVDGQFLGSTDRARELLDPLLSLRGIHNHRIVDETLAEALLDEVPLSFLTDPAPASLRPVRVASDFCRYSVAESAEALVDAVHVLQQHPGHSGGGVLVEPADGAIHDRTASDTAFPHRGADLMIEWEIFTAKSPDHTEEQRGDEWLAAVRGRLAPHLVAGRYLNYGDLLDTPRDFWEGNLERLRSVADAADPNGVLVTKLRPPW